MLNEYVFSRKITPVTGVTVYGEGERSSVVHTIETSSIKELVEGFAYFLLGCSFDQKTINDTFSSYGECANPDGNRPLS